MALVQCAISEESEPEKKRLQSFTLADVLFILRFAEHTQTFLLSFADIDAVVFQVDDATAAVAQRTYSNGIGIR